MKRGRIIPCKMVDELHFRLPSPMRLAVRKYAERKGISEGEAARFLIESGLGMHGCAIESRSESGRAVPTDGQSKSGHHLTGVN